MKLKIKLREMSLLNHKKVWAGAVALVFPVAFLLSCSRNDSGATTPPDGNSLRFDMALPASAVNNSQVYVFQGTGANQGQFYHKVMNITRGTDFLSMAVPVGTWDIGLVTSTDPDAISRILHPTVGVDRDQQKMWETTTQGGFLPSSPELLTARVDGQAILANQTHNASTSFARNVAMIKVVVKEAKGFKTTGDHMVYLGNVPTSLNWSGGLYPSKTAPEVSSAKMKGILHFSDIGALQKSDTAVFIVPAHKGSDFLLDSPTDTTTNKLTLSVDFLSAAGANYVKNDVTIPLVPQANKIMVVNLFVKGSLQVETTILDWVDSDHPSDISQTSLQVSKTNLSLSYRDTILVKSSVPAAQQVVTSNASWITLNRLDEQHLEVVANIDTYIDGTPRSSYIDIKANNLTKRIGVNQRPETGTLFVTPASIWLSPTTGNTTRTVAVSSANNWVMLDTPVANATPSVSSGNAGTINLDFTRKFNAIDNGDYSMYGNQTVRIKNTQTLEVVNLAVQNLYLHGEDIFVGNPRIGQDTTVYSDNIFAMGGTEKYTVVSKPEWVTSATVEADGRIKIVAERDPNDDGREGNLVVAHADDPTYQITVKVVQDFIVLIPAFNYFVLKFTWQNNDVDIGVRFFGNGTSFDSKPVGYGMGYNTVVHNSQTLLQWGGDATGGQGETVFFNAPVIDNDATLPRYIKMEAWATWWTSSRMGDPVKLTISAYLGGTMVQSGTNFNNIGGELLYEEGSTRYLNSATNATSSGFVDPAGGTNSFAKVCDITYDRIKHTARIQWIAPISGIQFDRVMPMIAPLTRSAGDYDDVAYRAEKDRIAKAVQEAIKANKQRLNSY